MSHTPEHGSFNDFINTLEIEDIDEQNILESDVTLQPPRYGNEAASFLTVKTEQLPPHLQSKIRRVNIFLNDIEPTIVKEWQNGQKITEAVLQADLAVQIMLPGDKSFMYTPKRKQGETLQFFELNQLKGFEEDETYLFRIKEITSEHVILAPHNTADLVDR